VRNPRRVLVTIGHGKGESLGHHLAGVVTAALAEDGAEHRVQDLLADGFDPVLRLPPGGRHAPRVTAAEDPLLHRYQEDVIWADRHVILHPSWWFSPPAILKGWVDRVLAEGVAFRQPPGAAPTGLLGGRRVLVVQTFNATRAVEALVARGLAPSFWRRGVFLALGVGSVDRVAVHGVEELRPPALARAERRLRSAVRELLA
jgi:putative NADPH-quinone reductase